ncbi:MAG TPA: protoheme IX farnesyltransferase [Syntrophomonadaceae bacterium]|nr:protoheme IX farnesyltransferase [Syntrophomonadaceae bacterium]
MKPEERPVDGYQQAVKYEKLSERIRIKLQAYWELTKSKQTFLLLITGWAGFASAGHPVTDWVTMLSLLGSLYLAISGSTVLNMYMDRDIDARMPRTVKRPLPAGVLRPREALAFGSLISLLGVVWAFTLGSLFGVVVAAGLFFHAVVYTMWLKRKTAFSVIPGGVSGGMPVLAGRVLGTGSIDIIGVLLALAVLLWIPIHILTFAMRYAKDYNLAKVPTFPALYGEERTRMVLAVSTILTGLAMLLAVLLNGVRGPFLLASILAVVVLIILAVFCSTFPTSKRNFLLFKAASIYMLASMLLVGLAG